MSHAVRRLAALALGLLVLLAYLRVGEWLVALLNVPVPGSVAGMVLLAVSLRAGLLPRRAVRAAADALLGSMALFFVPPGVGLMLYGGLLREAWLPIVGGAVAGTLAVLVVVGGLAQRLEARG